MQTYIQDYKYIVKTQNRTSTPSRTTYLCSLGLLLILQLGVTGEKIWKFWEKNLSVALVRFTLYIPDLYANLPIYWLNSHKLVP